MFDPLVKLEELKKKTDKIIICECDDFTSLLIHKMLIELFGEHSYTTMSKLQKELITDPMESKEFIITTSWSERDTELFFECDNVRIYSFSKLCKNGKGRA